MGDAPGARPGASRLFTARDRMILSHDWCFIFVKTEKTAGTSVEMSLSRFCGPLDIVTPIHARDEAGRLALGQRARNFVATESPFEPEADFDAQETRLRKLGQPFRQRTAFYNHMSAAEIRNAVGPRIFDGYFKFAVERDPRDRLISYYYWLGQDRGTGFRDFVAGFKPVSNWERCTIDGRLAVDRLIRFDRLEAGLREVLTPLGIEWDGWLPRAKSGLRPPDATVEALFDEETTALARERFAKDFELYAQAR
jgi:hypothetical protein